MKLEGFVWSIAQSTLNKRNNNKMNKIISKVCCALAAAALAQSAQAQWTYTSGNLNSAQTYDGTGVDSALNPRSQGTGSDNDYIGNGATGSLTVQSGSLNINNSDFKVGQGAGGNGTISVASGATFNLNQVGQWGGGIGQGGGAGTINIASGGTLNWQTSGSSEQRFMFGNGTGGVGTLNLNGGTLYNYFDPAQALTDAERQFRVGSDGGQGIINLNAGLWHVDGAVPFFLGGKYATLNTTPTIVQSATVSTMNIIVDLETTPRRVYTGSIGHIAPGRKVQFNVAIRTVLLDRETGGAEYGLGGGIVWDSDSADEYAEALLKARVLTERRPEFSLLETLLWTPSEGWFLREKHLTRLLDSADYFGFSASRESLETYLDFLAGKFDSPQCVRLILNRDGALTAHSTLLVFEKNPLPLTARLAAQPVQSDNIFLFHKTTNRAIYESAKNACPECDDVLLYNERGELTEFTIGNLVVEMDGALFTPLLDCGLLLGTFRAHLLETRQVKERIIRVEELKNCKKVFLINSVRKWKKVRLV